MGCFPIMFRFAHVELDNPKHVSFGRIRRSLCPCLQYVFLVTWEILVYFLFFLVTPYIYFPCFPPPPPPCPTHTLLYNFLLRCLLDPMDLWIFASYKKSFNALNSANINTMPTLTLCFFLRFVGRIAFSEKRS